MSFLINNLINVFFHCDIFPTFERKISYNHVLSVLFSTQSLKENILEIINWAFSDSKDDFENKQNSAEYWVLNTWWSNNVDGLIFAHTIKD